MHNVAKVIHCDIKPENILVDSKGNVKISDFGISKMIDDKHQKIGRIGGTKLFLPPETWNSALNSLQRTPSKAPPWTSGRSR